MKNGIMINSFAHSLRAEDEGIQTISFNQLDFLGITGFKKRRERKFFFLKKKIEKTTKMFRYSEDWNLLTDRGYVSFWDYSSFSQVPIYALSNEEEYKEIVNTQKIGNDALYYCLKGWDFVERMSKSNDKVDLSAFIIPAMLLGAIIITAVLNLYAVSKYGDVLGAVKSGGQALINMQGWATHLMGLKLH